MADFTHEAFLVEFVKAWARTVTGPLSAVLFLLAFFMKDSDLRLAAGCIGVFCVYWSSYELWSTEKGKARQAEGVTEAASRETEILKARQKSEVRSRLVTHANAINELVTGMGIVGPYGHQLGFTKDSPFNADITALLAHLNFLRLVFYERDVLGSVEVDEYLKWARDWLSPWISANEKRVAAWTLFRDTTDVAGSGFVEWVAPHLSRQS